MTFINTIFVVVPQMPITTKAQPVSSANHSPQYCNANADCVDEYQIPMMEEQHPEEFEIEDLPAVEDPLIDELMPSGGDVGRCDSEADSGAGTFEGDTSGAELVELDGSAGGEGKVGTDDNTWGAPGTSGDVGGGTVGTNGDTGDEKVGTNGVARGGMAGTNDDVGGGMVGANSNTEGHGQSFH